MDRIYDLEERLTQFAQIIVHVDRMPATLAGRYYASQLLQSGGSPALHYAEAQSAESTRDFIHKCRIAHKELKETRINLNIQTLAHLTDVKDGSVQWLVNECEQLIRIVGKIIANKKEKLQTKDPNSAKLKLEA